MARNLDLAEGTQNVSATHTLNGSSFTTADVFGCLINLGNLAGGVTPDIIRLLVKVKVLSTDTEVTIIDETFTGGLIVDTIFQTEPVASSYSISFTLIKVQGISQNVPWRIFTL